MDKDTRGLLIGMVIGDGCLDNQIARLHIQHCEAQYEYIRHKANLLGKALNCPPPNVKKIQQKRFGKEFIHYRISKAVPYFRILRKWIYPEGKKVISRVTKYLTPHGIALWYMDNGSLQMKRRKKYGSKIHGRVFRFSTHTDLQETEKLIQYFGKTWNIRMTPERKKDNQYCLRCGVTEGKKLISLIEPYIIPCMQYKIDLQYPKSPGFKPEAPSPLKER